MATFEILPEEKVVMWDVSWQTYESLLADHADRRVPRFFYDRGTLEITRPSMRHEELIGLFDLLVSTLAEEWEIDFLGLGSTTFKRPDLGCGFEPDSCYYFQHASAMHRKDDIDLTIDPPPEMVIEVNVTHPLLDKQPLYAAFGIPEVWRYEGGEVTILQLAGKVYIPGVGSQALTGASHATLSKFIQDSGTMQRLAWVRSVRDWARSGSRK